MSFAVLHKPLLSERTTLGVGGYALAEAVLTRDHDLDDLYPFVETQGGRPFILGYGSNILAGDGELDLVLLKIANRTKPREIKSTRDKTIIRVGAGTRLPGLLAEMRKAGLSGLENLTGIPGTVGGAVAMNAGSYGLEIGDRIKRIRFWTPGKGLFWQGAHECMFDYRHFSPCFDGPYLVWEVELFLETGNPEKIRKKMAETFEMKKATQPVAAKSAGSVFKNPEGHSAGKLLDQAGFKGRREGDMAFSEMHANFMVNMGKGNSRQAHALIQAAREAVSDKFGIELETEVVILS